MHRLPILPFALCGAMFSSDAAAQIDLGGHRATFADAAELEVSGARLRLRFAGAHRGKLVLPRDDAAATTHAADIVRWQHGAVTEVYTLQPNGFEQSFVFTERPVGDGDLAIDIAATGNVTAPATARSAHQPLYWRHGDRDAIRYGEAFAFDRRGERIEVATAYDGAGRITLTVPAAFVDAALLPLTVDPAVGPVLLPAGTAYDDTQPAVAHNPATDHHLIVFRRVLPAGAVSIRASLVAGDGSTLINGMLIATAASGYDLRNPVVCICRTFTPNLFVVAWTEQWIGAGTQPDGIRVCLVNPLTGPVAPSFLVNQQSSAVEDFATISGPDGAFLVAWQGTTSGGQSAIRMRDLYWTTSSYTPVFGNERVLHSAPAGELLRYPRLAPCNAQQHVGATAYYLNRIVWERYRPSPLPGESDVWTMSFQLRPGVMTTLQPPSPVPGGSDVGAVETRPDIGVMASGWVDALDVGYLIAWQDDNHILAQHYWWNGPAGAPITVRATPAAAGTPAVGAGATEWTVAYLEQPLGSLLDLDVYAARVLANGTVAQDHRLVDNPGVVLQSGLRAGSQPLWIPGQTLRNTTLLAWSGRTGTYPGEDDVRARLYEPVAGLVVPYGTPCPGPAGEYPLIGSSGGSPSPGNSQFRVDLTGAPATSLAALLVGTSPVTVPIPGAPGCTLYTNLPFIAVLPAITSAAGVAHIPIPVPFDTATTSIYLQWGIYAPTANAFGWITSNDLDIGWSD